MNPNVPGFISLMFIVIVLVTLYMIYFAIKPSSKSIANWSLVIIMIWLAITGLLSYFGFYLKIDTQPARFALGAPLMLLTIILLFFFSKARAFMKNISLEILTYMSAVRIPVELTLWWLYLYNQIPQVMTFEGRNFDILAGITAPVIAYLVFTKKKWSKTIAYAWNLASLLLLINIIAHAVLSLPTPFQMMGMISPNWGMLYFPFFWLASFVAPAVFFSHLVSIYQLQNKK